MASLIDVVEECVWVKTAVVSIMVLRFEFCFAGRQLAGPTNLHCQKRNLHRQKHCLCLIPSPVRQVVSDATNTPPPSHGWLEQSWSSGRSSYIGFKEGRSGRHLVLARDQDGSIGVGWMVWRAARWASLGAALLLDLLRMLFLGAVTGAHFVSFRGWVLSHEQGVLLVCAWLDWKGVGPDLVVDGFGDRSIRVFGWFARVPTRVCPGRFGEEERIAMGKERKE